MIVAGFGFRQGVRLESLRCALSKASGPRTVDRIATLDTKSPEIAPLAQELKLPVVPVSLADMQQQETATQSAASQSAYGTGSVAEACALAAAGQGAVLLGPRVIAEDGTATCALAQGEKA